MKLAEGNKMLSQYDMIWIVVVIVVLVVIGAFTGAGTVLFIQWMMF